MATKAEIMEELEALGVQFDKRMRKSELEFLLANTAVTVTTTPNLLAVRKGPGKEYEIAEILTRGTVLEVYGTDGDWVQVRNGYVMAEFVE